MNDFMCEDGFRCYLTSISIENIGNVVCDYFGISIEAFQSISRKHENVLARQIAMYFSKNLTKFSESTISFHIGNKNRTTVIHSCKTINNLIETDKKIRFEIEEIRKRINLKYTIIGEN